MQFALAVMEDQELRERTAKLAPEEVLVVGDSLRKDIEPAESLGCQVLWLKGKGWTDDEDRQTHPHTITRVTEVTEWLHRL